MYRVARVLTSTELRAAVAAAVDSAAAAALVQAASATVGLYSAAVSTPRR
jgi:hypothetical protein